LGWQKYSFRDKVLQLFLQSEFILIAHEYGHRAEQLGSLEI
jgi:hypothetical protein